MSGGVPGTNTPRHLASSPGCIVSTSPARLRPRPGWGGRLWCRPRHGTADHFRQACSPSWGGRQSSGKSAPSRCPCFSKSIPCNHGAQPTSCSPVIGPVSAAKAGIPDTRNTGWHGLYASPFHVSSGSRCQVAGCGFCLCPQDALVLTLGCGGTHWKRHLQADSCLRFLGPGSGICCLGRFTVVSLSICPLLGNCCKPAPVCTHRCCTRDQERWWGAAWPGAGSGVGTVTRQDLGWGRTLSHLQCVRTV